jgi:hypothetical protein
VNLWVTPPAAQLPTETATVLCEALPNGPHLLQLAADLEAQGEAQGHLTRWQSAPAMAEPHRWQPAPINHINHGFQRQFQWPEQPTVLALVPHWRCERWLKRCLQSLRQQTQPLTHIVVIDDASAQPPLEIIQSLSGDGLPEVTLLQATARVGPYRLIQSVIDRTNYTAYLFQDADDWSSCDRLEILLKTARQSGAEIVGTQEIRVLEPSGQLQAVGYPLDVNEALAQKPGHALLHPTSLVTKNVVQRLGGFATGLRFGGDTEFLLRAHWRSRIVNCDRYCYFRRKRPNSLTTATATGLDSPMRQALLKDLKQRAIALNQQAALGEPLDLRPLQQAPPVELKYLWGPSLQFLSTLSHE